MPVSSMRPLRSMNTCDELLTRMSEISGSFSSASSGPRPNSSLSTSPMSDSRSPKLRGMRWLSRSSMSRMTARTSGSASARDALGEPVEVQPVQQVLVDPSLQRLVGRRVGFGRGFNGCHECVPQVLTPGARPGGSACRRLRFGWWPVPTFTSSAAADRSALRQPAVFVHDRAADVDRLRPPRGNRWGSCRPRARRRPWRCPWPTPDRSCRSG